jgi:hypothetical protein
MVATLKETQNNEAYHSEGYNDDASYCCEVEEVPSIAKSEDPLEEEKGAYFSET